MTISITDMNLDSYNNRKMNLIKIAGLFDQYNDYNVDTYYSEEFPKSVIKGKYIAPEDNNNLLDLWARIAIGSAHAEYKDIIREIKSETNLNFKKAFILNNFRKDDDFDLIDMRTTDVEQFAQSYENFWAKKFFDLLLNFKFVPGGRINFAVGRRLESQISAFNCYFIPFSVMPAYGADSLEAIYECIKDTGLTYASQGGVGNNLSVLRPRGAPLRDNTESPGAVAFMDLISINTNTIAQYGRRGANMQVLSIWHPDIEHFIDVKNDNFPNYIKELSKYDLETSNSLNMEYGDRRKVSYSNISILINKDFMESVIANKEFELIFPDYLKVGRKQYNKDWNGNIESWKSLGHPVKVYKSVKARELWDKVIHSAWKSAEPGIIFENEVKTNWTINKPFNGVNPCAEITLSNFEPCDLGHIALDRFVDSEKKFDFDGYNSYIKTAIRLLDNIHTINEDLHALTQQKEASLNYRRVGLGITGLGDTFIRMAIGYDSPEAIKLSEKLAKELLKSSIEESINIAKEKGSFPEYDEYIFLNAEIMKLFFSENPELLEDLKSHGIRNCAVNTIAPVGSGSIIAQCSSGIEPLFNLRYERKVKKPDGEGYDVFITYERVIRELFGSDSQLPDYAKRTAHKVSSDFRVELQSVWQKYIMNSISSTVNLPEDVDQEVVSELYINAYKKGLKGITVYREGSRAGILTTYTDPNVLQLEQLKHISHRQQMIIEKLLKEGEEDKVNQLFSTYGFESGHVNGEKVVIPENWDIPKRPKYMQGYTVKRTAEGRKWYITLNFIRNGVHSELYEVFATTNHEDKEVDIKPALENLINTLYSSNIDKSLITKQILASQHQHIIDQTMRMLSLGLRHKIPLENLVECFDIENLSVTHITYHIMKILAERIPDGTKSTTKCSECSDGILEFSNGCYLCKNCGFTKC